jgi:hypothetical protein
MKKLIILICLLLQAVAVLAEPIEIDGLKYDLNMDEKTACVSSNNSYNGILVIQETVTYDEIDYTVTEIAQNAFYRNGLLSITIPNSVKKIGNSAFYYCSSLANVKLGDGVETIGSYAFYACGIVSITFGNKINSIGGSAFESCSKLTQVYISDLSSWCRIKFGDTTANPLYYSHHLYLGKKEVKELVIPDGITEINSCAFAGASNILSLTFNNEITSIDSRAFYGCSNIESIQIPDGITTIEAETFYGCYKLENIKLPESLKIIKSSAFQYCTSLTNVIIPSKVEFIYYYAFYNTTENELSVVMMPEYPPLVYAYSFPNGTKFYVPEASIEPYQNVAPWINSELATFSGLGPEKCVNPEIKYNNGKISFTCQTPDVKFHYKVTSEDFTNSNTGEEIPLSAIYKVSVYASKAGYENSETVTSEINIMGIRGDLTGDGIVNVADHVELSNIIMSQEQ